MFNAQSAVSHIRAIPKEWTQSKLSLSPPLIIVIPGRVKCLCPDPCSCLTSQSLRQALTGSPGKQTQEHPVTQTLSCAYWYTLTCTLKHTHIHFQTIEHPATSKHIAISTQKSHTHTCRHKNQGTGALLQVYRHIFTCTQTHTHIPQKILYQMQGHCYKYTGTFSHIPPPPPPHTRTSCHMHIAMGTHEHTGTHTHTDMCVRAHTHTHTHTCTQTEHLHTDTGTSVTGTVSGIQEHWNMSHNTHTHTGISCHRHRVIARGTYEHCHM